MESIEYLRPSGSDNESSPYHEKTLPAKYTHIRSDVPKYSLPWFSRKWERAVKTGIGPRILYSITGILALSVWMGIMYVIFMIVY